MGIMGQIEIDLRNEDCLEALVNMDDNCVDSIVTDPPYGLKFMNKHWDYDVPSVAVWKECLRVLKPGGHLLSFGGTRTYHRMVVAIEDAGFEIRDQIQWLYGSGFPKSLNVSKALDGILGKQSKRFNHGGKTDPGGINTQEKSFRADYGYKYEPSTDAAKQWQGWGTALKPANEPICLARKPLSESTVAKNVLKHGTGGINIDGCRVETTGADRVKHLAEWDRVQSANQGIASIGLKAIDLRDRAPAGRFPANLILDEVAAELLDAQSGYLGKSAGGGKKTGVLYGSIMGKTSDRDIGDEGYYGDSGGASRFFYCAKSSKSERNAGCDTNGHPTVKPVKLMQYLIKLITPPGGTVLDPYMGSGSTGVAAKALGFKFIGIEREAEYVEIAKRRIKAA